LIEALLSELAALSPEQLRRLDAEDLAEAEYLVTEHANNRIDELCGRVGIMEEKGILSARSDSGCLYWLQNWTRTIDDHAMSKGTPVKMPFPPKSFFRPLLGELLRPVVRPSVQCQSTAICKSREMMTSWMVCGYISWLCQYRPGTFAILQTQKESKAAELIRYITILQENQPEFLQERHPREYSNVTEIGWKNGSRALAVPSGENQIRLYHPFCYVQDESAFLAEAEQCYGAVVPVAKQIILVSTASPGWFADVCAQ
jgi:hypothetical protein